jgi:ABC-type uncharacterized transport system substrate-binding protein
MALRNRLPIIGSYRDLVDGGGLMSYSTDIKDGFIARPILSTAC